MAQVTSIANALLFKKTPKLPELDPIDLQKEQQKANQGNIAALPQLEDLAASTNEFQRNERLKALREIFPDLDSQIAQLEKNLGSQLKGEIPTDVANAVQNTDAAKALGGTGSSLYDTGFNQKLLGRDLARTSYDIMQQGQSNFDSFLRGGAAMIAGQPVDFTGFFVKPLDQAKWDQEERNTMWNYNWFKNQLDAQPKPWEKAVGGLLDWIANTGLSVAGAYAGGGGLGGMAGGAGGTFGGAGEAGAGGGIGDFLYGMPAAEGDFALG